MDRKTMLDKLKAAVKPAAPVTKPPVRKFEDTGKEAGEAIRKHKADLMAAASYKKGGVVKKTGPAKLHAKERVLTVGQTRKLDKKPSVKKSLGIKR